MKRRRLIVAALGLGLGLGLATTATAHEGIEHAPTGGEASSAADDAAARAPRMAFSTAEVEVLVVREPTALVIYVDDFATNAPLTDLQLSVQSGAQLVAATPAADGSYRVPNDQLAQARAKPLPLHLRLHGKHLDEDLRGELPAAADSADAPVAGHTPSALAQIGVAVLLGIGLVAGLALRRRHRR